MDQAIRSESRKQARERFLFFSRKETRDRCPVYEDLGLRIAEDPEIIDVISSFPRNKRQPNLLLASLRRLLGHVPSFEEVRAIMMRQPDDLLRIALSHGTQTNEPGRCATLLPLLCRLPQPLALLEVGASAGLCLVPDRYSYAFNGTVLRGSSSRQEIVLHCKTHGQVPVPDAIPSVAWRAGLDTNPLDVNDPEQREWLELLVWPSEHARLARLRIAMDLVSEEEFHMEQGDLHADDLDRLCARAPKGATLVVFHSAVLSYTLDQERRDSFARRVGDLADHWISNESPMLFSEFGGELAGERPGSDFLLALNGSPIAWAGPHGTHVAWIDSAETPSLTDRDRGGGLH